MDVIAIYDAFANFTDQLLRKSTRGKQQTWVAELKAYVDGTAESEPIYTGYVLTYELKVNKCDPATDIELSNQSHTALLLEESSG